MHWKFLARVRRLGGRPRGWWSVQLAGALSAIVVPLLILTLGLITELLASRGELTLPREDAASIAAWAGIPDESATDDQHVTYRNRGLLPLVHRRQHDLIGGSLWRIAFQTLSPLRSNLWCLVALVASGILLAALESLLLLILYRAVQQAVIDVEIQVKQAIHAQAFRLGASDLLDGGISRAERLLSNEIPTVRQGLVLWWRALPRSVVLLGGLLAVALWIHFWLTLAVLLAAALIWSLYRWLSTHADAQCRLWSDRARLQEARLIEQLRLVPLVVGYNLGAPPGEPIEETLRQYRRAAYLAATRAAYVVPAVMLLVLLGSGLFVFLIGFNVLVEPPSMSLPGTLVLGTSLTAAYFPGRRLYLCLAQLPAADTAAATIFAYLDRESHVGQAADARPASPLRQQLQIEGVTLADRSGGKLLDGVTLTIPAGSRVALVSSDPAAAASFVRILTRFYDPAAGRILWDGESLHQLTLESLRRQVLLVAADGMLFTGTVAENIGCDGDRFTLLQIADAAKQARAYNFIQQLPHGFSTIIGQHGVPLDAARALRIGLARAVLREPSLLIVEEPAAPMDETSAGHVDEALRRLARDRTMILLPSRLETLRSADRVFLLHRGKLAAEGPHADLLQQSELYRHLVYVRFNPFRSEVKW